MQDANYNTTAIFDNSGNVVERYVYDPFGQVTVLDAGWNTLAASAVGWLYLHQGGRFDATSGLYHFRHRDYSPTLGRWTSLDPSRYAAGDVNLYRYIGNTPTVYTDPSGLAKRLPLWVRFVNSWDSVLGHHRTGWFAQTSNFAAGWGDTLSFGATSYIRQGLGYDDVVDYDSGAYFGGQVVGTAHGFALGWGAAGRVPATGVWAYRAAQGYTAAGTVYGVGHSSYVLITDPPNFGWGDALSFMPLAGYGIRASVTRLRTCAPRGNFASQMEAAEAARYQAYWQRYAPDQVTPGITRLDWFRVSGRTGRLETSRVIYDEFGRQRYRVDFTDHLRPGAHSNPHLHEYLYGPGYNSYRELRHNLDGR